MTEVPMRANELKEWVHKLRLRLERVQREFNKQARKIVISQRMYKAIVTHTQMMSDYTADRCTLFFGVPFEVKTISRKYRCEFVVFD